MANSSESRKRLYFTAIFVLILGMIALWLPYSWEISTIEGRRVAHIGLGLFKPLEFIWSSSGEGFQFSVSEVRTLPLAGSALLTLGTNFLAWLAYRKARAERGN